MNDLDKKLHDFLYRQAESYYFEGSSPQWFEQDCPILIEELKQAFKEAGYIQPGETLYAMPKGKDLARELAGLDQLVDDGVETMELASPMMTGQEWYDRFKQEFLADKSVSYNGDLLAVARRAAGLE